MVDVESSLTRQITRHMEATCHTSCTSQTGFGARLPTAIIQRLYTWYITHTSIERTTTTPYNSHYKRPLIYEFELKFIRHFDRSHDAFPWL